MLGPIKQEESCLYLNNIIDKFKTPITFVQGARESKFKGSFRILISFQHSLCDRSILSMSWACHSKPRFGSSSSGMTGDWPIRTWTVLATTLQWRTAYGSRTWSSPPVSMTTMSQMMRCQHWPLKNQVLLFSVPSLDWQCIQFFFLCVSGHCQKKSNHFWVKI